MTRPRKYKTANCTRREECYFCPPGTTAWMSFEVALDGTPQKVHLCLECSHMRPAEVVRRFEMAERSKGKVGA